jgi:tripartite-type tricarboxylate transporter receptor subunit TctC
MNRSRRRLAVQLPAAGAAALAASALLGRPRVAAAQETWPARPLRCTVPFAAGGILDITTRALSAQIAAQIGQPVVVENRAGANGNIGTEHVLRTPADGYNLMACSPYLAINPHLVANTRWKSADFSAIGLIGAPPNLFVVPASLPVNSMRELVDYVKARPGQLNVTNPSAGSSNHLGQELLFGLTGMDMQNVMYKTQAEMLPDLVNGMHALSLMTLGLALPHVREGRLKALAISAPRRSPELPAVPTLAEAGYGDAMFLPWFGLVAPATTPRPIVRRLSDELQKALAQPELIARLEKLGTLLVPMAGDEADAFIARENARWSAVIRQRGIKPLA